jgi:GDP-L-fucose synthase
MDYHKVLVTGAHGMLGRHLQKILEQALCPNKKELDLLEFDSIDRFLSIHKPEMIVHAAAKVGGIIDNISYPYDFFEQNTLINTNIIKAAIKHGIPRFLGLSSTCAYPDSVANYPMLENNFHDGPPAPSNFAYGFAKRAMCVQIDAANKQLGTKYNYILPCNLYSEFDSLYDTTKMHFITSLLYKIAFAEINKRSYIEVFGTGAPQRQFMYAGDLAKIIKLIIDNNIYYSFNVAPEDSNHSIDYMTKEILSILGKKHLEIRYNNEKPDGQYRKDVSSKLMRHIIGDFKFSSFKQNIPRIYKNYVKEILAKNKKTINT